MKKTKILSILFWVISIILTFAISYYQKLTGPTYPVAVSHLISNSEVKAVFPRSHPGDGPEIIKVYADNPALIGEMKYKRFKSYDDWRVIEMQRRGDSLFAEIPHQPPAGKVEYQVFLRDENHTTVPLTENPLIIRFRADVPALWMILHIIFIFGAFMLSFRTGFEAVFKWDNAFKLTIFTVIFLFLGGLVFGPIIQKYSFDAFWTGWPFGTDLTDNKTLFALIFWLIALWRTWKDRANRKWIIIAALVMLIIFLIPHSMFGSEIDYTKIEQ